MTEAERAVVHRSLSKNPDLTCEEILDVVDVEQDGFLAQRCGAEGELWREQVGSRLC